MPEGPETHRVADRLRRALAGRPALAVEFAFPRLQRFAAGLGNYLRADILFEAGLHPAERAGKLDPEQRRSLAAAILRITKRAYRGAGVTNEPDRVARLRSQRRPRHAWRHLVFAREGQPCWACDTKVERITSAGRRLYLCPSCQAPR